MVFIPDFRYPVLDSSVEDTPLPDHSATAREPTRAETARTDGAGLGLRARSLTPVAALGETQAVLDAHLDAYRRERAHPGPYARDFAEAVACANLRAAGLLPDEEEAAAAEAELDATLA